MTVVFGIAAGPEIILEVLSKIVLETFVRDESLEMGFFVLRG
jgi:hypothetical protein